MGMRSEVALLKNKPRFLLRIAGLKNGGTDRNRTSDTRIFSPLLYQLSYRAICEGAKLKGVPFRASMGNFVGYFLGREQRLEIGERKFGRSSVAGLENIGE